MKNGNKPEPQKKKTENTVNVKTVLPKISEPAQIEKKEYRPILLDEQQSSDLKIEHHKTEFKPEVHLPLFNASKKQNIHFLQFSAIGNTNASSFRTNRIGISLLWGVHGSSKVFEIAGIGSVLRKNMQGFQFSPIFNSVGINTYGFQLAGIMS